MLAEISDKMPTVGELWGIMLACSLPALVGIVDRRVAFVVLIAATSFSALASYSACYDAFIEPGFSDAVQGEMGQIWITNSIASAWLPAAVALVIFCWHLKKQLTLPRQGAGRN